LKKTKTNFERKNFWRGKPSNFALTIRVARSKKLKRPNPEK
jgi:hypothetical protein